MRDPALDGDGVELLFHLVDPAYRRLLELPLHRCLDSRWRDKDTRTRLPKSLHQRAVIKLANHARMDAMFIQPLVNTGPQMITAAGQQ